MGLLSEQRIIDACIEPERLERAVDRDSPGFAAAWTRAAGHLDLLHQAVAHDHATLVLVAIPAAFQLYQSSVDFHRDIGYRVHDHWLTGRCDTLAALEHWARATGVPLLDLTDNFRRTDEPLYFTEDG